MNHPQGAGPRLEVCGPDLPAQIIELKGADLQIGRAPGQDIRLDDARVSRHHARLEHRRDGSAFIVDLDSKSSTELNGRKLAAFQPAKLRDGSLIKIVEYELVFRDPRVAPPEKAPGYSTVLESLDDLSSSRLARSSSYPAEALEAVLDVNRALGGGSDLDDMLGRALDGLMTVFPAMERGFILIVDPQGQPRVRAVRQRGGSAQALVLSSTLIEHVLHQGKAVLIRDTTDDSRFNGVESVISTVRTALCVPLLGHAGERLGMVQLDRSAGKSGYKPGDLDLLAAVSVPIAVVVENQRLLKERASWAAAREIQLALLPRGSPKIRGYAFWECYRPSLEVGGDLYDYIAIERPAGVGARDTELWGVAIGDVAGKGMPAALLAASIRPEIRHMVNIGVALEEVMARVNRHIINAEFDGRFLTMALLQLDVRSHEITVVNAGHVEPLVRRAGGAIEPVHNEGAGPPLGVDPRAVYKTVTVPLSPGDTVILYTDGVTDAQNANEEPFGEERLRQTLSKAQRGAAAAGEAVLAGVTDFAPGPTQFDDITIICFERLAD
jgi:serine phosphatase RsbU (regulator of sigma subunit)